VLSKVSPPMLAIFRPPGMGYWLWWSMRGRFGLPFAGPQVRSRGKLGTNMSIGSGMRHIERQIRRPHGMSYNS
jgi:hypothetical protein